MKRTTQVTNADKRIGKKTNETIQQANKPAEPGRKRAPGRAKKSDPAIEVLSSTLRYDGPLFRVYTDEIREDGKIFRRDVIRHHGSVVILAIDDPDKEDPLAVVERQYRHAANEYLIEIPAGTLDEGEDSSQGAKRELLEETGFTALRWRKLTRFFASPGFLAESMQVFLAEGLVGGDAKPEEDEQIEVRMVRLSELLRLIELGKIRDAKTMTSIMLYDRLRRQRKRTLQKK